MISDFNEITGNHEKRGGRRRAETSFIPLCYMLDNCGMIDFPYKGNSLSCVERRHSEKVKCRLGRAAGNKEWHHIFSHTNVEYLKLWGSDHRLVLTYIQSIPRMIKKSFRSDKRWVGKPEFKEAVVSGWTQNDHSTSENFHHKLAVCRRNISK